MSCGTKQHFILNGFISPRGSAYAEKSHSYSSHSCRRSRDFPDVPTLKEAGFDVPDVPQIRGVLGPPAMPADAVAFYSSLFQKTTRTPAWQRYLKDNQFQDAFLSPEDTRKFIAEFEGRLRGVLQQAGVKVVR